MQKLTRIALIIAILSLAATINDSRNTTAQEQRDYWPTEEWQFSTPEEHGMDPLLLDQMMVFIEEGELPVDSVIIVRHGYIVLEAYPDPSFNENNQHILYSTTKSITSALIGIAIQEGFIEGIDQHIVDFFPDRPIANLDSRKQAITVEHLLTMSAGFEWQAPDDMTQTWGQAIRSGNPVRFVLNQPMAYEPGTVWYYNGGCSHLLSAIITETTGQSTLAFAREYLFEPLGITDVRWPRDPQGYYFGGQDIWLKPRDMARFGYLFLNNGWWDGQQIVSEEWVVQSAETAFTLAPTVGYGYQWWTYPELGVYYAAGAFEQRIFVVPDLDLVVVFTANNRLPGETPGEYREGAEFVAGLLSGFILPAVEEYPAEATYQGFGFSLQHPPGMVFTDSMDGGSTETGGVLTGVAFHETVQIGWGTADRIQEELGLSYDDLDPAAFLELMPSVTTASDIATVLINNNAVLYQSFDWVFDGTVRPGIAGVWYCHQSDRAFFFTVQSAFEQTSPEDLYATFQRYLASFSCE